MPTFYNASAPLVVSINGTRLGLVERVRTEVRRELLPIRARGRSTSTKFHRGGETYRLVLQRLIPELPDSAAQTLQDAENFTLSLSDGTCTVNYSFCQLAALTVLTEAENARVEELEIHAASRTMPV